MIKDAYIRRQLISIKLFIRVNDDSLKQPASTRRPARLEMEIGVRGGEGSVTQPAEAATALRTGHLVAAFLLLNLGTAVRAEPCVGLDPPVGV